MNAPNVFWIGLTFLAPMVGSLAESVLCRRAPASMARLAWFPFRRSSTVALPRALLDKNQEESAYRASARGELGVQALPLPTTIPARGRSAWAGSWGWVLLESKDGVQGVARFSVRLLGDRVVFTSKAFVYGTTGVLLSGLLLGILLSFGLPLALCGLVYLGMFAMQLRRTISDMQPEVESVVQSLGADLANHAMVQGRAGPEKSSPFPRE